MTSRHVHQKLGYGIQVTLLFSRINQVSVGMSEATQVAKTLELASLMLVEDVLYYFYVVVILPQYCLITTSTLHLPAMSFICHIVAH